MSDYNFTNPNAANSNQPGQPEVEGSRDWLLYQMRDLASSDILANLASKFQMIQGKSLEQMDFFDHMFSVEFMSRASVMTFLKDHLGFEPDSVQRPDASLSLAQFVQAVEKMTPAYVHFMVHVGDQSAEASSRIEAIVENLARMSGLEEQVSTNGLASQLMAINTQFDAAHFGQVAHQHEFVADHIFAISERSVRFASEVNKEVEHAHQGVEAAQFVIDALSKRDIKGVLALQSHIYHCLSRLKVANVVARHNLSGQKGDQWIFSDMQHALYDLLSTLAILLLKLVVLSQLDVLSQSGRKCVRTLSSELLSFLRAKITF